jgi:hypothetical protein
MNAPNDLLAVLVDADNVPPSRVGAVLAEVAQFGTASVKRVYGDWTTTQLNSWKTAASEHVIQPMQQFAHTKGKNSTDSALIIDAMDLLYTGRFQGFCIVSSDSDFTRLASRIREQGITVYGFGERKTPASFRNACDQFTYFEVLGSVNGETSTTAATQTPERPTTTSPQDDRRLMKGLRHSISTASAQHHQRTGGRTSPPWASSCASGNRILTPATGATPSCQNLSGQRESSRSRDKWSVWEITPDSSSVYRPGPLPNMDLSTSCDPATAERAPRTATPSGQPA